MCCWISLWVPLTRPVSVARSRSATNTCWVGGWPRLNLITKVSPGKIYLQRFGGTRTACWWHSDSMLVALRECLCLNLPVFKDLLQWVLSPTVGLYLCAVLNAGSSYHFLHAEVADFTKPQITSYVIWGFVPAFLEKTNVKITAHMTRLSTWSKTQGTRYAIQACK